MTSEHLAAGRGRHRLRAATQWTMTATVRRRGPWARWRLRRLRPTSWTGGPA